MRTFSDIIEGFGGAMPFGVALGIPDSHARTMKARDSIPPEYWPQLVKAAPAHGVKITFDELHEMRARKFRPGSKSYPQPQPESAA